MSETLYWSYAAFTPDGNVGADVTMTTVNGLAAYVSPNPSDLCSPMVLPQAEVCDKCGRVPPRTVAL